MFHLFLAAILSCFLLSPANAASRSDYYRAAKAATALIVAVNDAGPSLSMGSGFFVHRDGLLVTNAHVIEDSSRLYVYVHDDTVYGAPEVVSVDPDLDLAALRVPVTGMKTLALAAKPPVEGTEVIAVGYPRISDILQMGFALHATVGSGLVGGMSQGRSRRSGRIAGFVQTTGILNFGNSGGPLVDTDTGEVVGMVTTTVPYLERARDRSGAAIGSVTMRSGIGYSIPAPVIRRWLESQHLEVTPPDQRIPVGHGAEPEPDRSFATGHLLQTIAMVLQQDPDLLRLAIHHYETAAELKPDAPWIARNLGRAYASLGQWNRALEAYAKALALTPNDPALLTDTAVAWQKIGERERAAETYRAAVRANPRSGQAHNNLGRLLWEMGKLDEAIHEFRQAVDQDPTLAPAAYNLGLALEAKGRPLEAISAWEAFLGRATTLSSESNEWKKKMLEAIARLRPSLTQLPALTNSVQ